MAGYGNLTRIQDPATQAVCKTLYDQVNQLLRRIEALEQGGLQGATLVDAGGRRIGNVGTPTQATDAATLGVLRAALADLKGVSGVVDTATAQTLRVQRGIIVEIT